MRERKENRNGRRMKERSEKGNETNQYKELRREKKRHLEQKITYIITKSQ